MKKFCSLMVMAAVTCDAACSGGSCDETAKSSILQMTERANSNKMNLPQQWVEKNDLMALREMMNDVKQQVGDRSYSEITPEAKEGIDGMLALCTEIEDAIKADHDAAEASMQAEVEKLSELTAASVHLKREGETSADAHDIDLGSCREGEGASLGAWEQCKAEEFEMTSDKEFKCATQESLRIMHWKLNEVLKGEKVCDWNVEAGKPARSCAAFDDVHTQGIDPVIKQFDEEKREYTHWKSECAAATDRLEKKIVECNGLWDAYVNTRFTCEIKDGQTAVKSCEFGDKLQEKCNQLRTTTALIDSVQNTGAEEISDADRRKEWQAVQEIKCLLVQYEEGGTFTGEACDIGEYPHTHNYHEAEIAELTSTENFNCGETSVTFSGVKWVVGPSSGSYSSHDWHPEVELADLSKPAFSWCDTSGQSLAVPTLPPQTGTVTTELTVVTLTNPEMSKVTHEGVGENPLKSRDQWSPTYWDRSCSHTEGGNTENWWKATIPAGVKPQELTIYNREDCCAERLQGATVSINGNLCFTVNLPSVNPIEITLEGACAELTKTEVDLKIEAVNNNPLTICGLELRGFTVTLSDVLSVKEVAEEYFPDVDPEAAAAIIMPTLGNLGDVSCKSTLNDMAIHWNKFDVTGEWGPYLEDPFESTQEGCIAACEQAEGCAGWAFRYGDPSHSNYEHCFLFTAEMMTDYKPADATGNFNMGYCTETTRVSCSTVYADHAIHWGIKDETGVWPKPIVAAFDSTQDECIAWCETTEGCSGWTYRYGNENHDNYEKCWLWEEDKIFTADAKEATGNMNSGYCQGIEEVPVIMSHEVTMIAADSIGTNGVEAVDCGSDIREGVAIHWGYHRATGSWPPIKPFVSTQEECIEKCETTEDCAGWSWRKGNDQHPHFQKCFLMMSDFATTYSADPAPVDFNSGYCHNKAVAEKLPANCHAYGDVITEGEGVFQTLEGGCRWTTDNANYKTVLRGNNCAESTWVANALPFVGCAGTVHVVFRSDESGSRDQTDKMQVVVDGEVKLEHFNTGCNPTNCPVEFEWTADDKEFKVISTSSNAVYHLHMMVYDITFEPTV